MGNFPAINTDPYQIVSFASANRIATPTAVVHVNKGNFNAVQIFFSFTVDAGTDTVVINFDTWNSRGGSAGTGSWVEVFETAALGDVGEFLYQFGGVGAATANVNSLIHPGAKIRIRPVHTGTDGLTYSITTSWLRA
jgi:hypothetical protein